MVIGSIDNAFWRDPMKTAGKMTRTVLCLGPPHSGKSVFAYLLFKSLRQLRNDSCVMDADYYAPTYSRITEFADPAEIDFIYKTPNAAKLRELTPKKFRNLAHSVHAIIERKGIIVLDGLGIHSDSTESLLELAEILVVLCPGMFNVEESSMKCGYVIKDKKFHPFDFYCGRCRTFIKLRTHLHEAKVACCFDQKKLEGVLVDLDRTAIRRGDTEGIPLATRRTITEIAKALLAITYKR